MKAILLLFCLIISIKFFGQKVTYKDLIGTSWTYSKMPKSDSISFVFLDSLHYQFYYWKGGKNYFNGQLMNYSLDTSYTPTLWYWGSYEKEYVGEKIKVEGIYCFIHLIEKNILQAQSLLGGKKPKKKIYKKNNRFVYSLIRTG
jgi:hypothetical protein